VSGVDGVDGVAAGNVEAMQCTGGDKQTVGWVWARRTRVGYYRLSAEG
jgi:hypothetical protein